MRAVCHDRYGSPDVLHVREVDKPKPEAGEVRVRVRAAAVNPLDWHQVTGLPYIGRVSFGLPKPKQRVPGVDFAGQVEAVGKGVTRLQPGDEVFGGCKGAFGEYARASEKQVAPKPGNLDFEHAAALPVAGITALQALRDVGKVKRGQRVLINGAAGGVGTFAVQIAKSLGAEVTGVCSARSVDLVRSIGADDVIDYAREDFTRDGRRYDLILDNAGNHPLSELRRALSADGTLISNSGRSEGRWIGAVDRVLKVKVVSPFVRERLRFFLSKLNYRDLMFLKEMAESQKVTPVIDRTFPLSQTAEAIAYVGTEHGRGKVVIAVDERER